ncbi:MAG: class I SAM-dependent methyltransferase [Dehalococcoidia bacterium]|nr:class I SAM-dependent methyltransferase [Dehalococcoidia bacterium]MDD5494946.1 class I SAM-dependent methyltransferase [Dehalococcoidia bacterium]
MSDAAYDVIGESYNRNRTADRRILETIIDLLNLPAGKLIADIGAGTGNYANALAGLGYRLFAIEPSGIMRQQAVPHGNVTWLPGFAESLPLQDASVDGVIMVLSVHHFSDIRSAAREAARVCPAGPLVMLTMDPRESEKLWFYDYFPEIEQHIHKVFPPLNEVIDIFSCIRHWSSQVIRFPLPHDLADKNMQAGWNRPEIYLDPIMRQNTSGFALASPSAVQEGITLLENDLRTGKWDRLNGRLRKQQSFDAGFRFLQFWA